LKNNQNTIDVLTFLNTMVFLLKSKLKELCSSSTYKFNLFVDLVYKNKVTGEIRDVAFKTTNVVCFLSSNLNQFLKEMYNTYY